MNKSITNYVYPKVGFSMFSFVLIALLQFQVTASNVSLKGDIINSIVDQQQVKGIITDENGEPLLGANVQVKGTNVGVVSNFDGEYSIAVPAEGTTLVFSFIGYADQEVVINGRTEINVQMAESANSLDEVVVTALGVKRTKRAVAYSVTELGGEELAQAKETNVAANLSGKIAGVSVNNLATGPGGSTRVVIRGNTSLTGNNQPLYVVDGVPLDNRNLGSAGMWGGADNGDGIGNINSDDIESMSVLKGNAAAALYGFRASNGVIIITTKRGKKNQELQVEINSNYVFDNIINHLDLQRQYGLGENGVKPTTQQEALDYGQTSWGGKLDGSSVVQFDGVSRPYSYAGDNMKRFYETGSTFTNTISFTGGTENFGFRFAASNMENDSYIPNSSLKRQNFTFNVHGNLAKKLTMSATGQYIKQSSHNIPRIADSPGNANYVIPNLPTTMNVEDLKGDPNKLGADPETGNEYLLSSSVWFQNPYWATYQYSWNNDRIRSMGSMTLNYKINDWVYINGVAGMDESTRTRDDLTPSGTSYSNNGSLGQLQETFKETNLDVQIGSDHEFDNGIAYSAMVGANKMRQEVRSTSAGGNTFAVPFFHSYGNLINKGGGIGYGAEGVHSVYGQAEVSYNQYLFLTGTYRNDWFSTLNGRSISYPSVSMSAIVSDMVELPDFINYFKVRGSWAQVGGATSRYSLNQTYGFGEAHLGQPNAGISGGTIKNANLKPLLSTENEFGFDVQFFGNRLGLDFTIYDKKTEDDILNVGVSQTTGYTGATINVGEVSNKGVEVLLTGTPVLTDDFRWDVSLNIANNKSKVVSLSDPENDEESFDINRSRALIAWVRHYEGMEYGQVSGYEYQRDGSGNIVVDENGLPVRGELVPFGTGVHPFSAGLMNTFKYKNFNLSFLIDMKDGAVIHNGTNTQLYARGLHKNTLVGRETGLGVISAANVADYYGHVRNNITEEFIQDASFIKLRQVTLGYKVPNSLVEKIGASSANLSFVARNLWVIDKKTDNIDPESTYSIGNGQGLEFLSVPQSRSFGLNLNVKF